MRCPRCRFENPPAASFCARCGLLLAAGDPRPGRIGHPQPVAAPDGFEPVCDAADLYWRCESALGGRPLIGTEGLRIELFEAGYSLRDLRLHITGFGAGAKTVLDQHVHVPRVGRGETVVVEVPSYELSDALERVELRLLGAEFAEEAEP